VRGCGGGARVGGTLDHVLKDKVTVS
jgi:hypothetical protein